MWFRLNFRKLPRVLCTVRPLHNTYLVPIPFCFAVQEMIDAPFETKSDSFYFVDDKLIMHNKAEYAYDGWKTNTLNDMWRKSIPWGSYKMVILILTYSNLLLVIYCSLTKMRSFSDNMSHIRNQFVKLAWWLTEIQYDIFFWFVMKKMCLILHHNLCIIFFLPKEHFCRVIGFSGSHAWHSYHSRGL